MKSQHPQLQKMLGFHPSLRADAWTRWLRNGQA